MQKIGKCRTAAAVAMHELVHAPRQRGKQGLSALNETKVKKKTVCPVKTRTTANQWQDLVLVYMIT